MTRREAKGLLSAVKDRINEIKKFGLHAAAYLTFNTFFFMLNVMEGPDAPVALLPIMIWGVVLGVHWNRVFGRKGKVSKQWEEAFAMHLEAARLGYCSAMSRCGSCYRWSKVTSGWWTRSGMRFVWTSGW